MPADWTRRRTLVTLAAAGLAACVPDDDTGMEPDTGDGTEGGTDAGTDLDTGGVEDVCVDRTGAQTAGPFYPGEPQVRMDVRGGVDGVVIELDLQVVEQGTCAPIQGAEVDLWGADADGDYSGYARFGTEGEDFMRGQQLTDADGIARFTAIVPGSYPGRAVHLHVKVRAEGVAELTTQVYLPDALVSEILADPRYSEGAEQTRNGDDGFYAPDTLLVASGTVEDGVVAEGVLVV